jgi:hypothetical protein
MARLRDQQLRTREAAALMRSALVAYRTNPWPIPDLMGRTISSAPYIVRADKSVEPMLFDAMSQPFAAGQWNDARALLRLAVAREGQGCGPHAVQALKALEPDVPWLDWLLLFRRDCYAKTNLRDYDRSVDDYGDWLDEQPTALDANLKK